MSRPFRLIWPGFLSFLAIAVLLCAPACKKQELTTATGVLDRNLPDETSSRVKITEFDGDRIDYELAAQRIDRFIDRRLINAIGVQIKSYDPQTGQITHLQADSTIVDDARNMIFAYGNVELSSPQGSVSSASMVWDRNTDQIIAPGIVTVIKDGSTLRGQHLRTNSTIDYAELELVSADGKVDSLDFDW